jgi:hypothetical protein
VIKHKINQKTAKANLVVSVVVAAAVVAAPIAATPSPHSNPTAVKK